MLRSSSPPVVQRSRHTYGRRREQQDTSKVDTSFEAGNSSLDSREDFDSSFSLSAAYDVPPSSDDVASNMSPAGASEPARSTPGHEDGSDDEGAKFQWSWKAALKKYDEDDGDFNTDTSVAQPQTDSMGGSTRPAYSSDRDYGTADVFSGSLSPLTSSSIPSTLLGTSEARPGSGSLPASDTESDTRPSTPDTSPQHPIGTPRLHSSPTPPTSIEMLPKKDKGKGRLVEPLRFESDGLAASASGSKPSKPQNRDKQRKNKGSENTKRVKVSIAL